VKIRFHSRVFSEIDAIMKFYEDSAGAKLADDFYEEFRRYVILAAEHPEHFNIRVGGFKRVNLERFPYNFLFRQKDDCIRILVVRHHSRHPSYGAKRE